MIEERDTFMIEWIKHYMNFEDLVMARIVKYVHAAFVAVYLLSFLIAIVISFVQMTYSLLAGLGMLMLSPIMLVVALLCLRLVCEIAIVLFRMSEQIEDMGSQAPASPGA